MKFVVYANYAKTSSTVGYYKSQWNACDNKLCEWSSELRFLYTNKN